MRLLAWWKAISKMVRPDWDGDTPPLLSDLPDVRPEDHKRLIDETRYDILHRERVLKTLEAKANVRGHRFEA